jgi:pyrroline-5-carboxylate reductase
MLNGKYIALIGAGAMGEAIISGLLAHGLVEPGQVYAAEPREQRRHELHSRYAITTSTDVPELVRQGDVIIFAVKPQVIPQVFPQIHGMVKRDALCLSILAGTPLDTFVKGLGHPLVVRAMPNTPAQIGEGMIVWTATPDVNDQQRGWAQAILGALGRELFVEDEHYLDMATAINGSGPAYIFLAMEAMIDAGVHLGFSRQVASDLVFQTVLGSVRYAMQSDQHLAQLRNAVTSPGGTTAAGLNALQRGGLPTVLSDAIWAAYNRSRQLGGKE